MRNVPWLQGPRALGGVVPCPSQDCCAAWGSGHSETHLSLAQKGPFSEGRCAMGLAPIVSEPSRESAGPQAWLLGMIPPPAQTAVSEWMSRVTTQLAHICRCDKDNKRGASESWRTHVQNLGSVYLGWGSGTLGLRGEGISCHTQAPLPAHKLRQRDASH